MNTKLLKGLSVTCLAFAAVSTFAQENAPDTLKSYAGFFFRQFGIPKSIYRINDTLVSKKTYKHFTKINDTSIKKCKPCWKQSYDTNEQLLWEAYYYGDCRIGLYREYYPNGKLKTEGHYKTPAGQNLSTAKKIDRGSVMHGVWIYYSKSGEVEAVEEYKDGVLMK